MILRLFEYIHRVEMTKALLLIFLATEPNSQPVTRINSLHLVEPNVNKLFLKPKPNEINNYLILGCKRAQVKTNLLLIWGRRILG